MKGLIIIGFCLLACGNDGYAQTYPNGSKSPESAYLHASQTASIFPQWKSDYQQYSRYNTPWLTSWPSFGGNAYWLGSTTTQSFNQGKFGTIYYYDTQGNMRNARTFIDISGKNKRGLKLLLPTINQRMLSQH
jgi:hypothetical protein